MNELTIANAQQDAPDDPFLWLEEVDGAAALEWVRAHNAATVGALERSPHFPALHARLKTIFNSRDRIPFVTHHAGHYYNFWRDDVHTRGLWRRTTPQQFALAEPVWESVLDLDRLAHHEQENWVWSGARFLPPDGVRCLVSLSRGGGDATVIREFDLTSLQFLADGFYLPEAKSSASWIDQDTLLVATEVGPASLTDAGYPRSVRQWRRGTTLDAATLVYEAHQSDLAVAAWKAFTAGSDWQFVERQITFYTSHLFLRQGNQLVRIAKPDDANAWTVWDQLLIELRSDWHTGARTWPQGALLAIGLAAFLDGARNFEVLFQPSPARSLDSVAVTCNALLLMELDNVSNRIIEVRHFAGLWERRTVASPGFGSLEVSAEDRYGSDRYFLTVNDFLTPTTLYLATAGSNARSALKSMPAWFDAARCQVRQYQAQSRDGTAIPYFVVMPSETRLDGNNPTLLYGYGGFEISLKPSYSAVTGAAWLEHGGIHVVANIRGGGEFGPRWHQAALRAQRQNAFDDFIAVAEDLIARKLSSPSHLGIMGGSNGGLLVGAVMTQRPELFRAVVCQVPLLDMRRYHRLLAGASWMGEYGDPDLPADWDFIGKYSPYHQVRAGQTYPRMLLTTSTRDDRVHPAHARKMVARMQAQGHDVLYWENMDGGHAGAANNEQQARMWALTYSFLRDTLGTAP
ncbi:MAG TPA: prolyl oligopeptidase family serine peptidase [Telluria sp.]|jgi:prolyl oligopeptidase